MSNAVTNNILSISTNTSNITALSSSVTTSISTNASDIINLSNSKQDTITEDTELHINQLIVSEYRQFRTNGIIDSSTVPQFTVMTDGFGDALMSIIGARSNLTTHPSSLLFFRNFDIGNNTTNVMGAIGGQVIDRDNNYGGLVFHAFSDGVNSRDPCLTMSRNGNWNFGTTYQDNYKVQIDGSLNVTDNIYINGSSEALNTTVSNNSSSITSLQSSKQDKLDAGTNITIDENNFISATISDTTYTAGDGLSLSGTEFSINSTISKNISIKSDSMPQLIVETSSNNGKDASIIIRGSRSGTTTKQQAQLIFQNHDNDLNDNNKIGQISGVIHDNDNNYGGLHFHNFPTGGIGNTIATSATMSYLGNWNFGDSYQDNYKVQIDGSLNVTDDVHVGGTITSDSDIKIKTNIKRLTNNLDKIDKINGYSYTKIKSNNKDIGVIAQEVEKEYPELVYEKNDIKSVNYDGFIGILLECIKELKEENKIIKNKLEQIEKNKILY